MLRPLGERIIEIRARAEYQIAAETNWQPTLNRIQDCLDIDDFDDFDATCYERSCYVYIRTTSFELAELKYIPRLAEEFTLKWTKRVRKSSVVYEAFAVLEKKALNLSITVRPKICQIKACPTGQMIEVTHTFTTSEPEVRYIVDCGEGEES
jgi:hypothetical protein